MRGPPARQRSRGAYTCDCGLSRRGDDQRGCLPVVAAHLRSDDDSVKAVAVFRFDNLSGEVRSTTSRWCSDELRRRLGPVPGLRIIARESIQSPILAGLGNADVAQRLGATHAVRGSLRRAGVNLSVNVSIERMATGEQLWQAQFERPLSQMLGVQAQVTEAVSQVLVKHLTDEQRAKLRKQPTDNERAWALYQRAIRWTDQWTLEAAETAIAQLREATHLDPRFALAYAALFEAYWGPIQMGQLPAKEAVPLLQGVIDNALEIDPNLSEGWAAAGGVATHFGWNAQKGLSLGRRAVELNPNSSTAWMYLAQYYMLFDPGNAEAKQAVASLLKLDPIGMWSAAAPAGLAVSAYQSLRQPQLLDDALAAVTAAKQLGRRFWVNYMQECLALRWQGQLAAAIAACERAVDSGTGRTRMTLPWRSPTQWRASARRRWRSCIGCRGKWGSVTCPRSGLRRFTPRSATARNASRRSSAACSSVTGTWSGNLTTLCSIRSWTSRVSRLCTDRSAFRNRWWARNNPAVGENVGLSPFWA